MSQWNQLPVENRQYLLIARELPPSIVFPEVPTQKLPFPRAKGMPGRLMAGNKEIRNEASTFWRWAIKGRQTWKAPLHMRDPVLGLMMLLRDRGLMVPTIWRDPPKYRRGKAGERYIVDNKGRRLFDCHRANAERVKAGKKPLKHSEFGCRDLEWDEMTQETKHRPELKKRFDPFKFGYVPTEAEKYERVMSFLADYAESGHLIESAKANGAPLFQMLLWANERTDLMEQVALAEATIRMGIRSGAQHMALNGDKQMITLLLREESDKAKRLEGGKKKVQGVDVSEETASMLAIAQRAREAAAALPGPSDE